MLRKWRLFGSKAASADILADAGRGQPAAIEQLFDQHADALYAFAFFRVGRDATLAEDIVQETLSLALAKTAEFDASRGSVAAWLINMSRNVIRDHVRQHRRGSQLAATWEKIDLSLSQVFAAMAEQPLPGDVLDRQETRDLVHMAIANLPPQYRTVLLRKYIDDASMTVVAQELGISEDATKSLLARARRAFRDAFFAISNEFAEVQS
jgi:RNA polymerase sigma-70 factor, ECF subfamily